MSEAEVSGHWFMRTKGQVCAKQPVRLEGRDDAPATRVNACSAAALL